MTIKEIQEDIIEEFNLLSDWTDKYSHIIDMGNDLPKLEEKYKIKENIVLGCQSNVWIKTKQDGDRVVLSADSDAIITKGLVALVLRVFSNQKAEDILNEELFFIEKIYLKNHLSPGRANGILSMIKKIKMYATLLVSEK